MNEIRQHGSDPDRRTGMCDKEVAKDKAAASFSDKTAGIEPTPKKVGNGCSKASSIRSYRMDDDEKDFAGTDAYVSLRVSDAYHSSRSSPRTGVNASDNDPYVALGIADAHSSSGPYASLRIAHTPRIRSRGSTIGIDGPNTSPYMPLKIAASHSTGFDDKDEVANGSNDSSGTEDVADYSDGSIYEQVDDGEDFGEDFGSEDDEFSTNNARVSVADSEQGKDNREFPGYARISVAGSVVDYGTNAGRQLSGYARVSVAGSEADYAKDRDEEFPGCTRGSVAGSEIDYKKDVYAKLSRAGSEADYGKEICARVSVAGSEVDQGQDVYARLSAAGSEAEHGGVGMDLMAYAKVSVAGSEAEYGKGCDTDVSGYARLPVVQGKEDHVPVSMTSFVLNGLKHGMGHSSEEQEISAFVSQDTEDHESWSKEYETYMELSPEIRAHLQYRVRLILISPLFELGERKLSAFSDLYKRKFGEDVEATGFSSLSRLCRAMPNVVQRKQLEENEVLILVDSSKNRRAVSGIRSGLRRIVYEALKSLPSENTFLQLEEKCSELLGKPLMKVLSEHGYDTPNVESLVQDMPDIAGFKGNALQSQVYLCSGAEDPALTDGLLIKSTLVNNISKTAESKEVENTWETTKDSLHLNCQREYLKIGSSVTLRSLKNELRRFGGSHDTVISSADDEVLQVRLYMRILLAFHNSGHGVEVQMVPELYAKAFCRKLDLQALGFRSIRELARHWQDIFLVQELKPGWVFLVPSQANRRILNTLRTGLRSSVFSVLVETYPEGLDPLEFLHSLQQGMSGELWEVLDAAGYICSDVEKADSILSSSSSSDFQLVDFEEICVLLDDMMDFVRLGSSEDGSVVVKLRSGEVPLVDLLDCKMEETDVGRFDELFVNLMMIAVDGTETAVADDDCCEQNEIINVGHVQSLVKTFEGSGGLRSAHSQAPDFLKLKHEFRLILGCPEYSDSGLAWSDLTNVYSYRTGQQLGSKSKLKSLLRAMPDIIRKDSFVGEAAHLFKSPKNLRILSTTRAGLRQVLFWALVKNPGGIWANLLEGWFTDFAGMSLAATLQMHGYEMSKSRPFFPVYVFLRDMNDLLQKASVPCEIYTWAGVVEDPVHNDAALLGLSELMIQYDPLRGEVERVSNMDAELVEEIVDKSELNEDNDDVEARLVNDCTPEKFHLTTDEGNVEAGLREQPALKTSMKGDGSKREAAYNHHHHIDKISGVEWTSGAELHHAYFEGPVEDHAFQPLNHKGAVAKEDNGWKFVDAFVKEDTSGDQYRADVEGGHSLDSGENGEDDENYLSRSELVKIEANGSESTSEAYAQLRVATKGPKVNLDEWQFTDSEDEGEDYDVNEEEEEEEEEEEHSKIENPGKEQVQASPAVAYVGPKVRVPGKDTSRAWVLPNKGIPWK